MNLVQAEAMVQLQNSMNTRVNPGWLTAGNDWLRAAMVEHVEAIEHHGWKWWKKQEPNAAQIKMEMVDIWHFYLSHTIVHFKGHLPMAAGAVVHEANEEFLSGGFAFGGRFREFATMSLLDKLQLAVAMNAVGKLSLPLFYNTIAELGMSSDDLYRMYVGKNVLNFFRQDHGYKEGTYVKMWEGREDNEWLVELASALDANDPNFDVKLRGLLDIKYAQVIEPALGE